MRYIGFDLGDGESAVAAFENGSGIEPVVLPVCGSKSLLSAVGTLNGETVIGEHAYTDALADQLSVRFKSRFARDLSSHQDVLRFAKTVIRDLTNAGTLAPEDRFVVGCPAGWSAACRARYRELLVQAGLHQPQVISESRAAFLYAKYARTVAVDIDIMNESALVVDMGSSTLDYAYIVDGREMGVGTFGETELGGGVLDAALLRRAVERCAQRKEVEAVFAECRSWYSYCEIEARRIKEEYFTRLTSEESPVVQKTLRVCYDGVQKLNLKLDANEASALIDEPLPELGGSSFRQAVRESLENAARLTADRPAALMLLTGGASRMPFFRKLCQEVFPNAVVVSCPDPEFSIAKGLAYSGWVDENLRAFRQAIHDELTDERVTAIATEALPSLLPEVAEALARLLVEEAAVPAARQWRLCQLVTLQDMNDSITEQARRLLSSAAAQDALAPVVAKWLDGLAETLQSIIDPICDRYEVPRRQMQLNLTAAGPGGFKINTGTLLGLPVLGTLMGVILSVITGILCGGGGLALVAGGPLGFLAGLAIGAVASLLGWTAVSSALMHMNVPAFLRLIPIDRQLAGEKTRRDLQKRILESLTARSSSFGTQVVEGFSRSLRAHVNSIAQAAEIPIES